MRDAVMMVVGAAGGIGSELCRQLAGAGARLVLAGRTGERLEALAAELPSETQVAVVDARRAAELQQVAEAHMVIALSEFTGLQGQVTS